MNITAEITEAINKHLSHEIGTALKERLQRADNDAELVETSKKAADFWKCAADEKTRELAAHEALKIREQKVSAREALASEAERRVSFEYLRVEQANIRVADMKEIVRAVFSNNRFKYSEVGSAPVGVPTGGYITTAPTTKEITHEG